MVRVSKREGKGKVGLWGEVFKFSITCDQATKEKPGCLHSTLWCLGKSVQFGGGGAEVGQLCSLLQMFTVVISSDPGPTWCAQLLL